MQERDLLVLLPHDHKERVEKLDKFIIVVDVDDRTQLERRRRRVKLVAPPFHIQGKDLDDKSSHAPSIEDALVPLQRAQRFVRGRELKMPDRAGVKADSEERKC